MSRFKVLTRIEVAIKTADKKTLDWADFYCAMRLQIATTRNHQQYWQTLMQDVRKAQLQAS
jgi:hypothetical protein